MAAAKVIGMKQLPSYERVRELFDYNPETGAVTRRVSQGGMNSGDAAGFLTDRGHYRVSIDGKTYRLSHVIWLWVTGAAPKAEIDHRDTVGSNNRWLNLREATRSLNCANKKVQREGLKGAYRTKGGRFMAKVVKDQKAHYLGTFPSEIEAHNAYLAKAAELFGEFARAA